MTTNPIPLTKGTLTVVPYDNISTCGNGSPLPSIDLVNSPSIQIEQKLITWNSTVANLPSTIAEINDNPSLYVASYTLNVSITGNAGWSGPGNYSVVDFIIKGSDGNLYANSYMVDCPNTGNVCTFNFSSPQGLNYCSTTYQLPSGCFGNPCTSTNSCCPTGTGEACCNLQPKKCYNYGNSVWQYCINSTNTAGNWSGIPVYPVTIYAIAYNVCDEQNHTCNDGLCGCTHSSAFTIKLTLGISLNVNCSAGNNWSSPICTSYCSNPNNYVDCAPGVLSYCVPTDSSGNPTVPPSQMPLADPGGLCYKFIEGYIGNQGPSPGTDAALATYCSQYNGLQALFNGTPPVSYNDQLLCACNLNSQQYAAFESSLVSKYPAYEAAVRGAPAQCLINLCSTSPFKNLATTKQCNVPVCVNVIDFDNQGSITNSNLNLSNASANCSDITGTPGVPGAPGAGISHKKKDIIAILLVLLAILLVGLILFGAYYEVYMKK